MLFQVNRGSIAMFANCGLILQITGAVLLKNNKKLSGCCFLLSYPEQPALCDLACGEVGSWAR